MILHQSELRGSASRRDLDRVGITLPGSTREDRILQSIVRVLRGERTAPDAVAFSGHDGLTHIAGKAVQQ